MLYAAVYLQVPLRLGMIAEVETNMQHSRRSKSGLLAVKL